MRYSRNAILVASCVIDRILGNLVEYREENVPKEDFLYVALIVEHLLDTVMCVTLIRSKEPRGIVKMKS